MRAGCAPRSGWSDLLVFRQGSVAGAVWDRGTTRLTGLDRGTGTGLCCGLVPIFETERSQSWRKRPDRTVRYGYKSGNRNSEQFGAYERYS